MNESTILEAAYATASTWAKSHGGVARLAEDPQHAIELLAAGQPGGVAIACYWMEDVAAGEAGVFGDPRTEGTVACAIMISKGLRGRGEESPRLLDLCAGLREAMVAMPRLPGMLDGFDYAGKRPLLGIDGRLLSGYVMRFSTLYVNTGETHG